MEELFSARIYKYNVVRLSEINYYLNTKKCISIPVYSIYLQVLSNLHTHTNVLFGVVMYVGLRGEGRRNWEGME